MKVCVHVVRVCVCLFIVQCSICGIYPSVSLSVSLPSLPARHPSVFCLIGVVG